MDVEVYASGFTREMQHDLEQEQAPPPHQEDVSALGKAMPDNSTEECVQGEGDKCIEPAAVSAAGLGDEIQTTVVRD